MSWPTVAEIAVWATVGILLASILVDDLRNYRIRNTTVTALAVLFVIYCIVWGRFDYFLWHAVVASVVFVILAIMYVFHLLGGGDVKLLTLAFLWLGPEHGFLFSVLLCVAALVYISVARLKWLPSRKLDSRTSIPFGPSIAVAWIITMLIAQLPRALA